jgi:hypothetical protein
MSLLPKPLLPSKLAPKLVAKPLVAPNPSQGKLTVKELELLEFLRKGEGGIANYGEKILTGKVLYQGKTGYQWCDKTKLWKEGKSDILAQKFFDDLFDEIDLLEVRVNKVSDDKENHAGYIKATLKTLRAINKTNSIWSKIEGFLSKQSEKFNTCEDHLPLKGGKKIHLLTGIITDRIPQDFWTYEIKATGVECSEEAKKDNLRYFTNYCIRSDRTVNVELLEYLQLLHGYFITYETGDKAFYVILGVGGTGKSQMLKRLESILTSNRISTCSSDVLVKPANAGNHATYLKSLDGLTMVYTVELEDGKPLNGAVVKQITGGDSITYRGAYDRLLTTSTFKCKVVVITNLMFKMDGGDSGLIDRLRRILFTNDLQHIPIEERQANEEMIARLNTQDGINATFAWYLEGARRVLENKQRNILEIPAPQCVLEESAVFSEESDSFKHFFNELCEVCPSPDVLPAYVYERDQFHIDYTRFCVRHSYTGDQKLSKTRLVDKIRSQFSAR